MAKQTETLPEGIEFEIDPEVDPDGVDRSGIPPINWESVPWEDEIEIVNAEDQDKESEDTTARDQLREELEKLKRQNEELLGKADSARALQEAIQGLGQQLRPQQQGFQMPQQQPGESDEEFKKKFNESIFEGDAYSLMEELQNRKLAPERHQQMINNLYHSKRDVEMDQKMGPVLKRYKGEVEEELNRLNPDVRRLVPDIYRKVTESVASRHMDELMTESLQSQVDERVKEALRQYGIDPDKPKTNQPAPNFAETNRTRPSGGGQKGPSGKIKASLTASERAYAQMKGVKEAVLWDSLQRNQTLKKFINEDWVGRR